MGEAKGSTIEICYNAGAVISSVWAGGICEGSNNSTVENCYNIGTVTGSGMNAPATVGGISGTIYESSIGNCYNIGALSGKSIYYGGVEYRGVGGIGGQTNRSTINNCYWNIDSRHLSDGNLLQNNEKAGIEFIDSTDPTTPLTSAKMKNAVNFSGFDFDEIWTMPDSGSEYQYPVFKGQTPPQGITTYTVTYNANGGSNAPAPQTKTRGVPLTLSAAAPQRTGYSFRGWAENNLTTEAEYLPGSNYTHERNATLYAVWGPDPYQYRFFDGINITPRVYDNWTDQEFYLQNVVTFANPPIARAGCELLGWSLTQGATVADYPANGKITRNSNTDFYAVWTFSKQTTTGNVSVTPASAFAAGTEMKVSVTGNNLWLGGDSTVVKYNITFNNGAQNNVQPSGVVTVRLEIPQEYVTGGGNVASLIVTYKGVPVEGATAVKIDGKWYMEFQTDHFSEYVIEESGSNPPAPTPVLKWWQKLSAWLQWILRWLCFGWIWMK